MKTVDLNCALPKPIVRETRLRFSTTDLIVGFPTMNDYINLSTGEVHVARIINGVRVDTTRAALVVGCGIYHGGSYTLDRIYRLPHGEFVSFSIEWGEDVGMIGKPILTPLEPSRVLPVAKRHLDRRDFLPFLRNWAGGGWMPADEAFVQRWAANDLSADEYETLFASFSGSGETTDDDISGQPRQS